MLPSVCTANKILEYKERYIHTAGCTHPVLNPLARYTRTCSDDYHLCPVNLHSKLCVENGRVFSNGKNNPLGRYVLWRLQGFFACTCQMNKNNVLSQLC